MKDIEKILCDNTFYYCSYPAFQKFGILTFEADGKIGGSHGGYEQKYGVFDDSLKFYSEGGREIAEFPFTEENDGPFVGKSKIFDTLSLVLVKKASKEVEVIKPAPGEDKKNLGTFLKSPYYEQARELALAGKNIDGYDHGEYFIADEADDPLGMEKYKGIAYQVEKPAAARNFPTKKMLVLFNSSLNLMSNSALDRQAPKNNYNSLGRYLAENTTLLRVADSNLISGSYYHNTENFPDYEERIQELIRKVAADHAVPLSNIVCYGTSKGGVGALIHGLIGNYPIVVFDPMMNRKEYMVDGDEHFCFDLVPVDFTERINHLLSHTEVAAQDIKIYTSEPVSMTFPYISKLDRGKCQILNVKFKEELFNDLSEREKHNEFLRMIFPHQAGFINELLKKLDIERIV